MPPPLAHQNTMTPRNTFFNITSPSDGIVSTTDITDFLNTAVKKGLIVSHESRCLTMDLGLHGRFEIKAQIESNVPRIFSAMPLATVDQETTTSAGSSNPASNHQPTDSRESNIYTPEFLRSVFGPDAGEGMLTIINKSTTPVPVFIFPNGQMRLLSNFQKEAVLNHRSKYYSQSV